MCAQMVVGYDRKIVEFEIVDIHRKAFFDQLFDELIDDGIALARAGKTDDVHGSENIDDVYVSIVPLPVIIKPSAKIHRIFVFDQPCFLHEALVFIIERIIRQTVGKKSAAPNSACEQANVSYR